MVDRNVSGLAFIRSPTMVVLGAIKALTFDCYGTLIDWERGDEIPF